MKYELTSENSEKNGSHCKIMVTVFVALNSGYIFDSFWNKIAKCSLSSLLALELEELCCQSKDFFIAITCRRLMR